MFWILEINASILFQYILTFGFFKCSEILRNVWTARVRTNPMQNKRKTKSFAHFFLSKCVKHIWELFGEEMRSKSLLSAPEI